MDGAASDRDRGTPEASGRPDSGSSGAGRGAVGRVTPVARGRAKVQYPGVVAGSSAPPGEVAPAGFGTAAHPDAVPGANGAAAYSVGANGAAAYSDGAAGPNGAAATVPYGAPVNGAPGATPASGFGIGEHSPPGDARPGSYPAPNGGVPRNGGAASPNGVASYDAVPNGTPPNGTPPNGFAGEAFPPYGAAGADPAELDDADAEGAGPRPGRSRHRSSRRRRQLPLWQEVPLLLFAAFLIAVLIRTFLLQAFYIPSGSMVHTLEIGDKVLVNKVVYDFREPARGEIIVFRGTGRWRPEHKPPPSDLGSRFGRGLGDLVGLSQPGEKDFIKRVIGLPGDTVACCDAQGRVTVNGQPLDEPYIFENSPDDVAATEGQCGTREFDPFTVPKGQVWVMGDHRLVSQDSRCTGPVPIDNIIGRAFLVVWPANRWDTLEVPDTFKNVPQPYAAPEPVRPYRAPAAGAAGVVGSLIVPLTVSLARHRRMRVLRPRTLSG